MKILFILPTYPDIGGIQTVSVILANELMRRGHSIHFLSHNKSDKGPALRHTDATLWLMPDRGGKYYTSRNNRFAVELAAKQNFDVIIYQDSYAPNEKIAVNAAKTNGIKLIVAEHSSPLFVINKRDLDPWNTTKGFLRRILHPLLIKKEVNRKLFLFNNCSHYVVLAESFRDEFSKITGVDRNDKKISAINNPIELFNPPTYSSSKENICIFVGRLVKEKQVHKLLKIWQSLKLSLIDWKFLIIGDGPEKQHLERFATKLNLSNVVFLGNQNPKPYYEQSKFILLCSKMEGWGTILVEAMQFGCIPVSLDSYSSLKYIIDDNKNGLIIGKDNDVNEWTSRITKLASNPEKMQEVSYEATVKSRCFDVKKIADRWEKLILQSE